MVNLPLILFSSVQMALDIVLGIAVDWPQLPDSLETVTTVATQIQTVASAALSHPIWAIATLLLTVVLIQMVADLIKRVLKASLTFLLKLPLMVSQLLWQKLTASAAARLPKKASPSLTTSTVLSEATEIEQLISRLEALREEQDQVVAELKTLLAATKAPSESAQSSQA
jgi:hypothetical protein